MIPETRFAESDGVSIAYQVFGDGPVDLVIVPGWVSNIEVFWEEPAVARFLHALSTFSRIVLFDKRGTGMSDRVVEVATLEQRMDDVRAVLDAIGSPRAALLGYSEGGPMCALFAATYPDRAAALIMIGSYARRTRTAEYPYGPDEASILTFIEDARHGWGGPVGLDERAPTLAHDPRFRAWWSRFLRQGASPSSVGALMRANMEIDVRHVLPAIRVPTLILHASGDRAMEVGHSRYLAAHILGARLVVYDSEDHLPFAAGAEEVTAHVQEFLTGARPPAVVDRVLCTIMFTDIVGSTSMAMERGDRRWTDLLGEHDHVVRSELAAHRGREINTTGDGFVAVFDGPARGIRCALAIREAVRSIGVELRFGLHTGECEIVGDTVAGLALHIAARVAALAPPDGVLASRTVKDLVAGSGIGFDDFGMHSLKGMPDAWRLYRVAA